MALVLNATRRIWEDFGDSELHTWTAGDRASFASLKDRHTRVFLQVAGTMANQFTLPYMKKVAEAKTIGDAIEATISTITTWQRIADLQLLLHEAAGRLLRFLRWLQARMTAPWWTTCSALWGRRDQTATTKERN
eukprot:TRINITY_DN903_c0_g1_i8.p4 TRINITY_DN903_c0_g1~~TRINITY_DN903_c0_g1_i8.p4  ORF type:complete len:135 (+),score=39.79 TRINITY_DN903_c0_g1_i8:326-730(+)